MRPPAALLPTLLIALSAHGEDDLSYARSLAERGYFDLAHEVCERIRTNPAAPADQKEALDVTLADILRRQAAAAKDPLESRDAVLESAAQLAERFAVNRPASPLAAEARLLAAEILRDRGRLWAQAAEGRREAAARAVAHFRAAEERLLALSSDRKAAGAPKDDSSYLRACYHLPLVRFDRALLTPPGPERDALLAEVVKGMDEFRWAFDGFAAAYDLAIAEGLAAAELRAYAKAVEALDSTIALMDTEQIDETTRPLIFRAFWVKAKVLAAIEDEELGRKWWPVACDAADRAEALAASAKELARRKVVPHAAFFDDAESRRFRMHAAVEKARALAKMGEKEAAVAAAQRAASTEGPWQDEACELLAHLAGGSDVPLPSRIVLLEGCIRREDWTGAMEQARLALDACKTPQEMRKHGVLAWIQMGIALQQLARYKEAAQAFEEVVRVYEVVSDASPEEKERAAECAYRAASCWGKQSARSGDPLDDAAYERAVRLLADRFAASPYSANAAYIVAERLEGQGKWAEAAAQYERVPEGAEARDRALLRIGYCRYQLAQQAWEEAARDPARREALEMQARQAFSLAEKELRASFERSLGEVADLQAAAFLLVSLLTHDAVKRYGEALPILDEVEKAASDRPEILGKAKAYRVEALVCLAGSEPAALERADEALEDLIASVPESPYLGVSLQRVGRAYAVAAAADAASRPSLERKAADRLRVWVENALKRGEAVRADDALVVVDYLLGLGEQEDVTAALRIAEAASAGRFGEAKAGEEGIAARLARAQVRAGRYAEAKDVLERLRKARPKDAGVLEDLVEAYLGLGRGGEPAYKDRALELLTELVSRAEVGTEPYWRGWWGLLSTLFETGRYAAADAQMISLEMRHPRFDEGRYGFERRFEELRGRIREKVKR